jgi:hypothetical protein
MKLVVPRIAEPHPSDARLIRLAEFLGIASEFVSVEQLLHAAPAERGSRAETDCLVVNPWVLKEWTAGVLREDFPSSLASRFPHLLIHAFTPDPFCDRLVKAFSGSETASVQRIAGSGKSYEIGPNTRDVCGPFAGLSFGPANAANDYVFSMSPAKETVRAAICIGGRPFLAVAKRETAKILFLGSADTLDIEHEAGDLPLSEYFSRFVVQAMALRYIFREECWHPLENFATFTLDDPLLQPKYGYLNFELLLNLMKEFDFATTVAFIPHNYRRNSRRTVQMFRESGGRLAICFHGNDHTAGELASTDPTRLNTMIRTAEARMDSHTSATGLPCPKVMVFPQDEFSIEAVKVLKSRNFCAAVCGTAHPVGGRVNFTLGERVLPAILRHGKFPLFLRKFIGQVKKEDVAFNLFFGQPVLVTEHHGLFEHVRSLVDDVLMINSIDPAIQWSDLGTTVLNSNLHRRTVDGVSHIRAYSRAVRITNDSEAPRRFLVEWSYSSECPAIEQVLQDGAPVPSFTVDDSAIRVSVELPSRSTQILSVAYRNDYSSLARLGFIWDAKAFTRRRLSEARDNYISKNDLAMAVGQTLKRRVLSKIL